MSKTKVCTGCRRRLATNSFVHSARSTGGRHPRCRRCLHEYYIKNKARQIGYVYNWNKRNPDKFRKIQERYRKRHPEWYKSLWKRHYKKHRKEILAKKRLEYRRNRAKFLKYDRARYKKNRVRICAAARKRYWARKKAI